MDIKHVWKKNAKIYFTIFSLSVSTICLEILATRVSSVIFVSNYAFIILSLAILGLSCGSIFAYYKIQIHSSAGVSPSIFSKYLSYFSLSYALFIFAVIQFSITNPVIFFLLLFLPYFLAGILYAQFFKIFAEYSFPLYGMDLCGAALGAIAPLGIIGLLGVPNSILLVALLIGCLAMNFGVSNKKVKIILNALFTILTVVFFINGKNEFMGKVPIGNFQEKDFYHVYPNISTQSYIIDSRWSVYGRSDLVRYSHQDVVWQLFVDGAAGTPMYRFSGNVQKPEPLLLDLLLRNSLTIPFLFLNENEKDSMLIIGPGGGKDVLVGLFSNVKHIVGVEVNHDFVDIVNDYSEFNGGLYKNYPNVTIIVKEGRHFVKRTNKQFDLVVMSLPSTEQLQNIDALAANENYLLTEEAICDYLNILTPEGAMIFTVHNTWELIRLIVTSMKALESIGISNDDALNHFAIIDAEYTTPTLVIRKNAFTENELAHWKKTIQKLPREFPQVIYLPGQWNTPDGVNIQNGLMQEAVLYNFLQSIYSHQAALEDYIAQHPFNISPCKDDSPFFYKVKKGLPSEYVGLLIGVALFNAILLALLALKLRSNNSKEIISKLKLPFITCLTIGIGFMILEVSLFQKFILYLGSPTVSLSILLCSMLVGMGLGSLFGHNIFRGNHQRRIWFVSTIVIVYGTILFIGGPFLLNYLLAYSQIIRAIFSFVMLFPLGFFLGILFPTSLSIVKERKMERFIPWLYGINGSMSVLGSVVAVVLSMTIGFSFTFFVGLLCYGVVLIAGLNLY